jgi:hypothetical protein
VALTVTGIPSQRRLEGTALRQSLGVGDRELLIQAQFLGPITSPSVSGGRFRSHPENGDDSDSGLATIVVEPTSEGLSGGQS